MGRASPVIAKEMGSKSKGYHLRVLRRDMTISDLCPKKDTFIVVEKIDPWSNKDRSRG